MRDITKIMVAHPATMAGMLWKTGVDTLADQVGELGLMRDVTVAPGVVYVMDVPERRYLTLNLDLSLNERKEAAWLEWAVSKVGL